MSEAITSKQPNAETRAAMAEAHALAAPMTDPIVTRLCTALQARSAVGIAKYGTTLARTDVDLRGWLQHAVEEASDLALYLTRAIEAEAASGWQPIETAPKDGRDVLLHVDWEPLTVVGRWIEPDWCCSWDEVSLRGGFDTPTHWMPLPKPPETTP